MIRLRLRESERARQKRLDEHIRVSNIEIAKYNSGELRPMTSEEFSIWIIEERDTRPFHVNGTDVQ
jgi:hypothetical protein